MPARQKRPEPGGGARSNGIYYHGGPVMLGTVNVYYIWYGNWSGNTATTILTDLAHNIGGSPYWNINTTYYNGANAARQLVVSMRGSATDNYSHGTSLSECGHPGRRRERQYRHGWLPSEPNGVYFVLTSADVTATSGFCTQYCGWHTYGTIGGTDIKYAFVGNPDRCPIGLRSADDQPEWQRRRRRDGQRHRSRIGRGDDRPGSQRLV